MERPWAQVIQFALELHPEPEPIIRAMLARPDDAFHTGLRLMGRCIANGATVSDKLRRDVGDRLVAFWVHAPSRSRERVGRLLADAFADLPSEALWEALHHRWLLNDGAGEIISRRSDRDLTLSVLTSLSERPSSVMIYHSLQPALGAAGDDAFQLVVDEATRVRDEDKANEIASLLANFQPEMVSRALALSVARQSGLPDQVRMRAHALAGPPLEDDGISLMLSGLRHNDWNRHYEAASLVDIHADPPRFLEQLLRDGSLPLLRRTELASRVTRTIPSTTARRRFVQGCVADPLIAEDIRLTLQLVDARFGNRCAFHRLLCQLEHMPVEFAATTIALFGHYPDRTPVEEAATAIRNRELTQEQMVQVANAVTTGMLYIFEMDFGFGGALLPTSPHLGIAAWTDMLEEWAERDELSPLNRVTVLAAGAQLGSERARADLETTVFSIEDVDGPDWVDGDHGLGLSHAVREVRRRLPLLRPDFVDRLIHSTRYNLAMEGVSALQAKGDVVALRRLLARHAAGPEWMLKDSIANTIELLASQLGVVIEKAGVRYQITSSDSPTDSTG